MGDVADLIIEGLLCQYCGALIDGEAPGFPRACEGCDDEDEDD